MQTKSIAVSQAVQSLANSGNISQATANRLSQCNRQVVPPKIQRGFADPAMMYFLIDSSGSMAPYRDAVIEGQHIMMETLRASALCRKRALHIAQFSFSTTTNILSAPALLDVGGNDAVARLSTANYDPDGGTALHLAVFDALQDMCVTMEAAISQSLATTFYIGVITDGEDTQGGADPADIKALVQELKTRGYLTKSAIFGLKHGDFTLAKVNEIKERLGFDEAFLFGQDPKEIRAAFQMASQSAMKAQG